MAYCALPLSGKRLPRAHRANGYSLERLTVVNRNALRINRISAATGQLPEPVVVNRAARMHLTLITRVCPLQKNTSAVQAAFTAVGAVALHPVALRQLRQEQLLHAPLKVAGYYICPVQCAKALGRLADALGILPQKMKAARQNRACDWRGWQKHHHYQQTKRLNPPGKKPHPSHLSHPFETSQTVSFKLRQKKAESQ